MTVSTQNSEYWIGFFVIFLEHKKSDVKFQVAKIDNFSIFDHFLDF